MKNAQIFVVGMHRSGTSAITNLLANMGAYFGDEKSGIGSNAENPKGFWERRDVRWANDDLLHSLGCEWDALSHWEPSTLEPRVLTAFKSNISAIFDRLGSAGQSFVIKDPRLCLLLPYWLECATNPVVVFVYRDPEEVAKSLMSRNGYSLDFGLKLWESYVSHGLASCAHTPSLFVDYANVIADELQEANRLYTFLSSNGASDLNRAAVDSAKGTVERGLRNQQASMGDEILSASQIKFKNSLRDLCSGGERNQKFDPVIVSSSDREECLRALEKYSRTKRKYDELQTYKDSLKDKVTKLASSIRPIRQGYHQLQYERNLLRYFDVVPRWFATSYLIKGLIFLLKPFAKFPRINKLINYHQELSALMNNRHTE